MTQVGNYALAGGGGLEGWHKPHPVNNELTTLDMPSTPRQWESQKKNPVRRPVSYGFYRLRSRVILARSSTVAAVALPNGCVQ